MGKVPVPRNCKIKCPDGFDPILVSPGVIVCKNPKTGEIRNPRLECELIMVDDPITLVLKNLLRGLLIIGAAYLVLKPSSWER